MPISNCTFQAYVSGFKPIDPEVKMSMGKGLVYSEVDSIRPTLKWEPFPGTHQNYADTRKKPFIPPDHVQGKVAYDLKIWRAENGIHQELVYSRRGLEQPFHTLEEPLQNATTYFWSVRARFKQNGKLRLSEWSLSPVQENRTREEARRLGRTPDMSFYRFKTPSLKVDNERQFEFPLNDN